MSRRFCVCLYDCSSSPRWSPKKRNNVKAEEVPTPESPSPKYVICSSYICVIDMTLLIQESSFEVDREEARLYLFDYLDLQIDHYADVLHHSAIRRMTL